MDQAEQQTTEAEPAPSTAADTSDIDEKHSVLDDLGAEVTGIAFPVSICMVLTIALVRILNKQDDEDRSQVIIAEAAYSEQVCPVYTTAACGPIDLAGCFGT